MKFFSQIMKEREIYLYYSLYNIVSPKVSEKVTERVSPKVSENVIPKYKFSLMFDFPKGVRQEGETSIYFNKP